jgi:hypothetical protein
MLPGGGNCGGGSAECNSVPVKGVFSAGRSPMARRRPVKGPVPCGLRTVPVQPGGSRRQSAGNCLFTHGPVFSMEDGVPSLRFAIL